MAALATFLGAAGAGAADTPHVARGPLCPLPYSPFSHELATPAQLVCKLDADDDGLDDLIENTIAECFMPAFRFDTAENALRTYPAPAGTDPSKVATQEPRALYSVVPGKVSDGTANKATIRYRFLWDRDGGYYEADVGSFIVPDEELHDRHAGDAQGLNLTVRFVQEGHRWMAELVGIEGARGTWQAGIVNPAAVTDESYGWSRVSKFKPWMLALGYGPFWESYEYEPINTRLRTLWAEGTHPIVYPSAGKHHFSLRTFSHQITEVMGGVLILAEVAATYDRANGLGVAITPLARSQVRLADGQLAEAFHNVGSLVAAGDVNEISVPNRCSAARRGLPGSIWYDDAGPFVGSRTLRDVWGYEASFASTDPFCGSATIGCDPEVQPLRNLLVVAPGADPEGDADGDGLVNRLDPCPSVARNLDFVGDPSTNDPDGDGLGDACDPSPSTVNRWVGSGAGLSHRSPYGAGSAFAPSSEWAGLLDADRDGRINGLDLCPDLADGSSPASSNQNAWAEAQNFQGTGPTVSLGRYENTGIDGPYRATVATLGAVYRGDACDPYETATPKPAPQPPTENTVEVGCDGHVNDAWEGGRVPIEVDVRALTAKAVQVEVVKCACLTEPAAKDCIDPISGECAQEGPPRRAVLGEAPTLYWSDVERTAGCARRADGSCAPLSLDAPAALATSWDWQAELDREAALPAISRHLAADWFEDAVSDVDPVDVPYRRARYPFAFATSVAVPLTDTPIGGPTSPRVDVHYPPAPRSPGHEAAVSPAWKAGETFGDEPDASRRIARMRTIVAPELRTPVTPHPVNVSRPRDSICFLSFPPDWPGRDRWTLPTVPEIDPYWTNPFPPDLAPSLRDVARGGPLWTVPRGPDGFVSDLTVWRGARERMDRLRIDGVSSPEFLAAAFDGAPVRVTLGDGTRLLPDWLGDDDGTRGWARGPSLLLSSHSAWALLVPARGAAEGATLYRTALRGALPEPLAEATLALSDHGIVGYAESRAGGRHLYTLLPGQAASNATELLLRPAERGISVLAADAGGPPTATLFETPIDQTDLRDDATTSVLRGHIVRVGGTDGAGRLRGDAVRFDAHTGQRSVLPGTAPEVFPARARPAVVWDADDQGIVMAGGIDASGEQHDDVYLLREGNVSATRMVPDSPPGARTLLTAGSPLVVLGTEKRAVRFGATDDFAQDSGGRDGWQSENVTRCADGATPFRCDGATWWTEPGARCAEAACSPAPAPSLAGARTISGALVIDAAPSAGAVWTVRGNKLERYAATIPGTLTASSATTLPALGTVVLPPTGTSGAGLVGHLRGVSLFRSTASAVQLEAPLAICGRPIDITAIAPDRFAIATTVGLAIASRTSAGLVIEASGLIEAGSFVSVPRSPAGQARCLIAELGAGLGGGLVVPRLGSTLAWSGNGLVLLRKSSLLQVNVAGAVPVVTTRRAVPGASHAVRVEGDTVYIAERNDGTRYDARTLAARGPHDVGGWVRRREAGVLRLRQRFPMGLGTVEIAWTAP